MTNDEFDFDSDPDLQPVSKSQLKREAEALQELGKRLVDLGPQTLARMPLPDPLRRAVEECARIKARGGHRRQLQYIGRLMREIDVTPIQAALEALDNKNHQQTAEFHRLERLRDALVATPDAGLEEVLALYPDADRQHLRQLARNAQREAGKGQPPKSARALFRYLRELSGA